MPQDGCFFAAETRLSQEAMAEMRAKWTEQEDAAHGYTQPLQHPDWLLLWNECVQAGAVVPFIDQESVFVSAREQDGAGGICCFLIRTSRAEFIVEG